MHELASAALLFREESGCVVCSAPESHAVRRSGNVKRARSRVFVFFKAAALCLASRVSTAAVHLSWRHATAVVVCATVKREGRHAAVVDVDVEGVVCCIRCASRGGPNS